MEDVGTLVTKFGLPVAALIAISWFFWRGLWPFLKARIENADTILKDQLASRQQETGAFLKMMAEFQSTQKDISNNLAAVATRLDTLTMKLHTANRIKDLKIKDPKKP